MGATEIQADDELAAAREASQNGNGELQADGRDLPDGAADDPEVSEEEDGQLFVVEHGQRVTLSNLVKRGLPVRYEFKLSAKGVKGSGDMGLIGFGDPDITLLVPARAGKVEIDPTYDGDGTVKSVTIRAHVKPLTVYDVRSEAARMVLGGESA